MAEHVQVVSLDDYKTAEKYPIVLSRIVMCLSKMTFGVLLDPLSVM